MPFPLLPLALALTAGGIGANYVGSKKAQAAQQDAMAAERIRQSGLDEEAFAIGDKNRDRYKNIEAQQDTKADELADMFLAEAGEAPSFGPAPSSDNLTVRAEREAKGESREYTDQQGRARAELLSLGDLFGDIGVDQGRSMTDLSALYGFKRGSQGVLPHELEAASQEGGGWRMAGDIMGGLGSVATMGALSGASMPVLGGLFGGGAAPAAGTNMLAGRPFAGGGLLSLFGR